MEGTTRWSNLLDLVLNTEPGFIEDMIVTAPVAISHNLLNFKVIWKGNRSLT